MVRIYNFCCYISHSCSYIFYTIHSLYQQDLLKDPACWRFSFFVSKYHYGARVPKTVISFPMVHDTIVGTGVRSYLNKPQLPYLRLPRIQKIKRNDIVTFNWPADTVRQFFVREKGVKNLLIKNLIT